MNVPGAARRLWTHPVLLVVPCFIGWSVFHLAGSSWDYDEGAHAYSAWLATQGHPLYTQTFAAYTPGFLVPLMLGYQVLGATMLTGRFVTVLFAATGLIGVAYCARAASDDDPLAEWGALLLLWLAPAFFQWSRAVMTDVPSGALMALGAGLALCFWRSGRLRWLFAAEAALAATLWVKLTAIGGAAAVALVVLVALRRHRTNLRAALSGSALVLALAALPLVFFDVPAMLDQAVFFHLTKRSAFEQDFVVNTLGLLEFLGRHAPLGILALWGIAAARFGAAQVALPVLGAIVWFAATFATLVLQTPLFLAHHPVVLLFPLAVLAGMGAAALRRAWRGGGGMRWLAGAVTLATLGSLLPLPERLSTLSAPPYNPYADEAAALLRAVTPPADLLVSDAQVIAFTAQRQSPPAFSDTSSARLTSGNLTAQMLIEGTRSSGANAVLFWSGRLESSAPFVEWVRQNFQPVRSTLQKPNAPYTLYLKEAHPQFPLEARIGDGVRLAGYDLNRRAEGAISAGQTLSVTLYFQRTGAVDQPYTIFTHLLASDGRLVAQEDRPPLFNRYPTDAWKPGEFVIDEFALAPAADLPAAEYRLALGMYRSDSLKRLPVSVAGVSQPEDRALSGSITVAAPR